MGLYRKEEIDLTEKVSEGIIAAINTKEIIDKEYK
jgi:hypothetical protein